jgi:uncharacterized membrane protein
MALVSKGEDGTRIIRKTLTIRREASELFEFWSDFTKFPRFMKHVESVTKKGEFTSHWIIKGPAGRPVEWDAVSEVVPDERISWESLPDADVYNRGEVRFRKAPGSRGTEVTVLIEYEPPAGAIGRTIASIVGEEPALQLDEDLYRFKQLMETGRIPTTEGQPVGGRQQRQANRNAERNASTAERRESTAERGEEVSA